MPNSIDFRADQIQTKQIIVTGSGAGTTKLLIYGIEAQGSLVNEGDINTTYFPQTGIGGDVFLYVSGALNTKGSATVRGTSVFGGDLVVSGSLYNGSVPAAGNRGIYSHAEGLSTLASGAYSHAEGRETSAIGSGSHAEGYGTLASGLYAHAEGYLTTGSGEASHAEGLSTHAHGAGSHTEGQNTITNLSATYSHAEGYQCQTSGVYSHAEGYQTHASGSASHTEGVSTIAYGEGSHAEGVSTIASGSYSHAGGHGTIASGSYQTVVGNYNKRLNTTSLFVVGNGTGDSDALRGDIFRAESTGELVLSGGIRHSFLNNVNNPTLMNLNYHMWVFDTFESGGNINVTLPIINDNVVDIGLTVVIKQHDSDGSGRIVTIRPTTGKTILGFNTEFTAGPGMVLTTLGGTKPAYTRRSITLTYTGLNIASGNYRWTVMATSEC